MSSSPGNLSSSRPCARCGNKMGRMTRCTHCNAIGCTRCIRNPGCLTTCPVCGRRAKIEAL